MLKLARENPKLVVITPAMPEGNSLSIVQEEFPKRVFDVGICEQHAVTFAAGLATQGYMPVLAIYSTFLTAFFRPDNPRCLFAGIAGGICHRPRRHRWR